MHSRLQYLLCFYYVPVATAFTISRSWSTMMFRERQTAMNREFNKNTTYVASDFGPHSCLHLLQSAGARCSGLAPVGRCGWGHSAICWMLFFSFFYWLIYFGGGHSPQIWNCWRRWLGEAVCVCVGGLWILMRMVRVRGIRHLLNVIYFFHWLIHFWRGALTTDLKLLAPLGRSCWGGGT